MKKRYILLFAIFLVMVSGCSIKKANYDIHETVKQLENIYMKAVHEGK